MRLTMRLATSLALLLTFVTPGLTEPGTKEVYARYKESILQTNAHRVRYVAI